MHHSSTIIVICVAIVFAIGVVAFAVFFKRRHTREKDATAFALVADDKAPRTPENQSAPPSSVEIAFSNDVDLLRLRIESSAIELVRHLCDRDSTVIWLGRYLNGDVAVKQLDTDWENAALGFASDVKTMARFTHPKIVRFIGVAWTNPQRTQAVSEFMAGGDLRGFLSSSRATSWSWETVKWQIAMDVADALVYLHTLEPSVMCCGIHSRNVLLDAQCTSAKLSNFSIGRQPLPYDGTQCAAISSEYRWVAPEILVGESDTLSCDIYSFGIILSELDTIKVPYYDAVDDKGKRRWEMGIMVDIAKGKRQPSFTSTCPEAVAALGRACLSFDPSQRPSALDVAAELRKMRQEHSTIVN